LKIAKLGFETILYLARGDEGVAQQYGLAILSNLRFHPANRTRLYKAQLRLNAGVLKNKGPTDNNASFKPVNLYESSPSKDLDNPRAPSACQNFTAWFHEMQDDGSNNTLSKPLHKARTTNHAATSLPQLRIRMSKSMNESWSENTTLNPKQFQPAADSTWTPDLKESLVMQATSSTMQSELADLSVSSSPRSPSKKRGKPRLKPAAHRVVVNPAHAFDFSAKPTSPEDLHYNPLQAHSQRMRLFEFEAVKGSKYAEDLFETFELPNGKVAHFYLKNRLLEKSCEVLSPPPLTNLEDLDEIHSHDIPGLAALPAPKDQDSTDVIKNELTSKFSSRRYVRNVGCSPSSYPLPHLFSMLHCFLNWP
jgi:hypothetical protein